jgi:hypothetical protein
MRRTYIAIELPTGRPLYKLLKPERRLAGATVTCGQQLARHGLTGQRLLVHRMLLTNSRGEDVLTATPVVAQNDTATLEHSETFHLTIKRQL